MNVTKIKSDLTIQINRGLRRGCVPEALVCGASNSMYSIRMDGKK